MFFQCCLNLYACIYIYIYNFFSVEQKVIFEECTILLIILHSTGVHKVTSDMAF